MPRTSNELTKLMLVACDMSYAGDDPGYGFVDSPLQMYPDTQNYNQIPLPFSIPSGYVIDKLFVDSDRGFKAIAFRGQNDVIMAFAGTDGGNLQDWKENLKFGWDQWSNNKASVFAYLDGLRAPNGVDPFAGKIHFTGQSLGGGLAEYAAYEFLARTGIQPAIDALKNRITVTTFNGFGGTAILAQELGGAFKPDMLAGLSESAAYYIANDVISRLGISHVGIQEYLLDYRSGNVNPKTGLKYLLDPFHAHRIEPGFYRNYNALVGFDETINLRSSKIVIPALQQAAALWAGIFSDKTSAPGDAKWRLPAGIVGGALIAPTEEMREFSREVIAAFDRAGTFNLFPHPNESLVELAKRKVYSLLGLATANILVNISQPNFYKPIAGVFAVALGADANGRAAISDGFRRVLGADVPLSSVSDSELLLQSRLALAAIPGVVDEAVDVSRVFADLNLELATYVDRIFADRSDWVDNTLKYLLDIGFHSHQTVSARVGFEVALVNLVQHEKSLLAISGDAVLQDGVTAALQAFQNNFAQALANTRSDFTAKYVLADASVFGTTRFDFVPYDQYHDALEQAASNPEFSLIRPLLEDALEVVESAGQTIQITQGTPGNPFNADMYDPDAAPVPSSEVKEAGGRLFTAYLAYEAPEGGQKIKFKLEGVDTDKLRILRGREIPISNGEFTLATPARARELTFLLVSSADVDADIPLALSATLIDQAGNATHQTHLELNLVLDAIEEGVLPVATNILLGDQQSPGQSDVLSDTAENDFIDGLSGDDNVTALAGGDDRILGGDGNDAISAGDGNDVIEAGAGSDTVNGGLGDDQLFSSTVISWDDALAAGEATGSPNRGDLLAGIDGHDFVVGGADRDYLTGGKGDDRIAGGAGDDVIESDVTVNSAGPNWNVTVTLADNVYRVAHGEMSLGTAGAGADVVYAGGGDDYVDAGAGDDTVDTGSGKDIGFGGAGGDVLFGRSGNDTLIGDNPGIVASANEGSDYLDGGAGDDILQGNGGDDILIGGTGNDTLSGGAGKDTYIFNRGDGTDTVFDASTGTEASVMVFGEGFDPSALTIKPGSLILDLTGGDTVHLASFDVYDPNSTPAFESLSFADGTSLSFDEVMAIGFDFDGTEENDDQHDAAHPNLIGTAFNDRIRGHGGNDTLIGLQGNDNLDGGAGSDRFFGDSGNDILMGGDDMDALIGGDGDDELHGGAAIDYIWGGTGNDYLEGGSGQDHLFGELGDDTYVFDEQDKVQDFLGATTIAFTGDERPEDIELRRLTVNSLPVFAIKKSVAAGGDPYSFGMGITLSSADQLAGMTFADDTILTGEDVLHETLVDEQGIAGGTGDDLIKGYAGADHLTGGDGEDMLLGLRGNDRLEGGAGDDYLDGGKGDDQLSGDSGADVLTGGAGNDELFGGAGSDLYLYSRGDGEDRIADGGESGDTDGLSLGGILRDEVTISREADGDLRIALNDLSGGITVSGYYNLPQNRIELIQFADGTAIGSGELDTLTVPPIEGGEGNDVLVGTPYADTLLGHGGADTLDGKGGDDTLVGGPGIDTYTLGLVPGNATLVEDNSENSIIRIASGLKFSDLVVQRSADDLVLSVRDSQSSVTVPGYYAGQTNWTVTTGAGQSKSLADLIVFLEQMSQAPQTTQEFEQSYLDDARRNYQIYLASLGASGDIRVNEQPFSDAATIYRDPPFAETEENGSIYLNIAKITAGGSANVLDLRHSSVVIADAGAGDDLIDNQGRGFSGTLLGSFLDGNEGDDKILGSWDADTLIGGTGNDYITGSDGNDTYVIFGTESGTDVIDEVIPSVSVSGHFAFAGGRDSTDTLEFVNVNFEDVTLTTSLFAASAVGGSGTYTTLNMSWGTVGHVRVILPNSNDPYLSQFPGESYGVEFIKFADGTVLTLIDQLALVPSLPRVILGTDRADSITGTTGNDVIFASGGNDTVVEIDGFNTIHGGPGNDVLNGGVRNDTLDGGTGDDILKGLQGNDTYLFGYGGGSDVIQENFFPFGPPEVDTLQYLPDAQPGNVITERSSSDLIFRLSGSADQLTVKSWFTLPEFFLDRVTFSDGTVWNVDAIFGQLPVSVINGTAGNDVLVGTRGRNEIYGLAGNDKLTGASNADVLDGGTGDDELNGGLGYDILIGGPGNDTLSGGEGSDVYRFYLGDGRDTISESDLLAPADVDILQFGPGILRNGLTITRDSDLHIRVNGTADEVTVVGWNDSNGARRIERVEFDDGTVWGPADIDAHVSGPPIESGGGNGVLAGTGSSETLQGGSGDEWLDAGVGNDTLIGGPGDDLLLGGPGADTYAFNLGNGVDTVYDPSTPGESNTVVFGDGITPDSLTLGLGSLLVRVGDTGDAIHFQSFDPENPYAIRDFDEVRFADGSALSYEQLLARGFNIYGADGADTLTGTALTDRIRGGRGDDILRGGSGSDVYLYEAGDGADHIEEGNDPDSVDVLRFGAGIGIADIRVTRADDDIVIALAGTGDPITLGGWFAVPGGTIERVEFADGTYWSADELESRIEVANRAPQLAAPLADLTAIEDAAFSVSIPAGAFSDPDPGDTPTLTATLSEGGALPAWLSFDPATRTFSGTPLNEDVGAFDITVTAIDQGELSVSDTFNMTVENVNDAPALVIPLLDQAGNQNAPLGFDISAETFFDVDLGDSLTIGASLDDGSPLPSWLAFDPASGAFDGTPTEFDVGDLDIRVTATDTAGAEAFDVFRLSVSDASIVSDTHVGTRHDDTIVTGFANDLIDALGGDDLVRAGAGRDVVFGGKGHDRLDGGPGDDLLAGGLGHDTIVTGDGDNLVIGGAGHDTITGGSGRDVFMVNLYDGKDVLELSGGAIDGNEDVISLGAGITADRLCLRRDEGDLIVETASADEREESARVTLAGWYSGADRQTVTTLQLFEVDSASAYDFKALVARFDAATQGQSATRPWSAAEALGEVLVTSGGDPIGGEVAREYATDGTVFGDQPALDDDTVQQEMLANDDASVASQYAEADGPREGPSNDTHASEQQARDRDRSMVEVLEAYLAREPRYDFEAFAWELERSGWHGGGLTPQEIARRWRRISSYVGGLTDERDENARLGAGAWKGFDALGLLDGSPFNAGFGYSGSISAIQGGANLRTLHGLEEGFQRLHA